MSSEGSVQGGDKPRSKFLGWESLQKLRDLFRETSPPREEMSLRLRTVERDVILPVKGVILLILCYYFYLQPWYEESAAAWVRMVENPLAIWQTIKLFFGIYTGVNVAVALILWFSERFTMRQIQWIIFSSNILDGVFLAAMTYVTGGFDSLIYWAFLGLIVRNALSCPRATPQLVLNFFLSLCYLAAGLLDIAVQDSVLDPEEVIGALTENPAANPAEDPTEPFLLRLILLWLVTIYCYGIQVLLEKQRRAANEAKESAARQEQLRSAGRLAAEIAHQIKNPLGIINTTAFSLQRAVESGKKPNSAQISIIREEVEKADKIITRLMGYAQLAEGKVEPLELPAELDRAIAEVFPPASHYEVVLEKQLAPELPLLIMQRGHLNQILVNVLLNAREAMGGRGTIRITAREDDDHAIRLTISDSGHGIPPERVERIFEPYFTTKDKGTGLGLSIVRTNTEMYGGSVRAESELGKGATFTLCLPTRTFMKLKA